MTPGINNLDDLREALDNVMAAAQELNTGEPFRCRELSLAVTKLEEAAHWLDAIGAGAPGE